MVLSKFALARYKGLILKPHQMCQLSRGVASLLISHNVYCVGTYMVLVLMFPNGGITPDASRHFAFFFFFFFFFFFCFLGCEVAFLLSMALLRQMKSILCPYI